MGNYSVIPSRPGGDGFSSYMLGKEILDDEMTRSLIGRICRKHGISYSLCNNVGDKYMYVFYVAFGIVECGERERLMDCINEIDNRTCVYCSNKYSEGDYLDPLELSYDQLNILIRFPFETAVNCPFDNGHRFLAFDCKHRKVPLFHVDILSDKKSVVFRDVLNLIRLWEYDTEIRVARPDARVLDNVIGIDGIVSACRIDVKFNSRPRCEDCSLYVVQMKDGQFKYAVVEPDGSGYYMTTEKYKIGKTSEMLRMHINKEKTRRKRKLSME